VISMPLMRTRYAGFIFPASLFNNGATGPGV
jgi:hypothetical protein